jgi:hypothetical protein
MGIVKMEIEYHWLRGTEDTGYHTHSDKLTMDPRKLKGLKSIVTHISNVNHWMMSHDNIWPVLENNHALIADARSSMHGLRLERGSQESTNGEGLVRLRSIIFAQASSYHGARLVLSCWQTDRWMSDVQVVFGSTFTLKK